MKLKVSFELSREEKIKLSEYLREEILQQMYDRIVSKNLEGIIRINIEQKLLNSQEVENLKSNKNSIRYALGVLEDEIEATVNAIIERVSNSVFLEVKKHLQSSIVLKLGFVKGNYSDLFDIPSAHFISWGKSEADIPWLKWLLTMGDTIIFDNYRVKYKKNFHAESRTGFAFMINHGTFRIPPGFGGTERDNFITRALEGIPLIIDNYLALVLS